MDTETDQDNEPPHKSDQKPAIQQTPEISERDKALIAAINSKREKCYEIIEGYQEKLDYHNLKHTREDVTAGVEKQISILREEGIIISEVEKAILLLTADGHDVVQNTVPQSLTPNEETKQSQTPIDITRKRIRDIGANEGASARITLELLEQAYQSIGEPVPDQYRQLIVYSDLGTVPYWKADANDPRNGRLIQPLALANILKNKDVFIDLLADTQLKEKAEEQNASDTIKQAWLLRKFIDASGVTIDLRSLDPNTPETQRLIQLSSLVPLADLAAAGTSPIRFGEVGNANFREDFTGITQLLRATNWSELTHQQREYILEMLTKMEDGQIAFAENREKALDEDLSIFADAIQKALRSHYFNQFKDSIALAQKEKENRSSQDLFAHLEIVGYTNPEEKEKTAA